MATKESRILAVIEANAEIQNLPPPRIAQILAAAKKALREN